MPKPRSHVDRRSCNAARIPDLPPFERKVLHAIREYWLESRIPSYRGRTCPRCHQQPTVVAAYDGQQLVGFGRVVTDGVLHAMIYDMIVHPAYQGRSIGAQVLRRLLQWCNNHDIRNIQLFCAQGKRAFYENHGFVARPEAAPGMQYKPKELRSR